MKKYYWLSYQAFRSIANINVVGDMVTTDHPFEYVNQIQAKFKNSTVAIVNWKEITEEEYRLFLDKRSFE